MQVAGKKLWSAWKRIAHRIAAVQARIVLALLYFVVLAPFALIARLGSHPFRSAGWQQRSPPEAPAPSAARQQF